MKKFKLITVIISIFLICAVVGGVAYFTIENKIKKENELQIVQLNKQKDDEKRAYNKRIAEEKAIADAKAVSTEVTQDDNFATDVVDEKRVYIKMHGMINTKIVSEDGLVWGEISIIPAVCDRLIEIVKLNNYEDKKTLTLFLNSWKKNDFSNGVEQHNYLWSKLGGVEGKAVSLR